MNMDACPSPPRRQDAAFIVTAAAMIIDNRAPKHCLGSSNHHHNRLLPPRPRRNVGGSSIGRDNDGDDDDEIISYTLMVNMPIAMKNSRSVNVVKPPLLPSLSNDDRAAADEDMMMNETTKTKSTYQLPMKCCYKDASFQRFLSRMPWELRRLLMDWHVLSVGVGACGCIQIKVKHSRVKTW